MVIQRVASASVRVDGELVSEIGNGLLLLVAIERGDTRPVLSTTVARIPDLRLFGDEAGKMNLSLRDTGGAILAVSQFTLAGSLERGRRPSFDRAAAPGDAETLFDGVVETLRSSGVEVRTGRFRTMMEVSLVNDGPVTFVLSSEG